jgi:hypothetical protein
MFRPNLLEYDYAMMALPKPSKTIKNHQKPSKTIKNHQKPSKTIKNHQKP